jgi:beta-lactam-binding protein with PASTA domain
VGAAPQPSSVPTAIPVAKSCKVPALKKLTLKQAKVKLKKAHCRLGKVTKKASKLKKGRVIATKPKAKTRLKANAKVALVVSRGR